MLFFRSSPRKRGSGAKGSGSGSPLARGRTALRLSGEAREPIELDLGELAVVGDDHEMVLDQAEHLHREPQPLARIGVAGGGMAPAFDVVGLDLRKDLFQQLAAQQLLGARATRDRGLELVVGHLSLPSWPGRSAS